MAKLTLQEQMLKAGLVNEKKLKKAKKGSKKSRVQAREAKAAAEENRLAQQAKDKELNQQMKEKQLSKEIKAQVKQLIAMNKIEQKDGEIKYNFTDGTLVKHLYVEDLTQKQLSKGILSIARDGEGYVIIPTSVANKIAMRDEESIVDTQAASEEAVDEDDPYKDFVVPDDLMW
ncbi:DUF2058 family protein [Vibrio sp. D404a]|uniref:DUF2058 domain-containing protein n=1 Tax=unclassified Vibrio TaxID=2614977 RepID=UPI00255470B5|nr:MULTISPECIES: DUF2058 domain-containing protein [unclassified Vibrio]MDK9739066.1 DUF2058 family protein [Vibrio sp. D404a]MDK9796609.1 DUF2058 family protein [Vibrio sp. D449a]